MITLLGAAGLAGLLVGLVVGWVIGHRSGTRAAAPRADLSAGPSVRGDEFAFPAEANFEASAVSLVERCAARVQAGCALVMRDREGAPASIVAISSGVDPRLLGVDVPLDSAAGQAVLEGIPVVAPADQRVVQTGRQDRRRGVTGGVAVPVALGNRVLGAVIVFGEPPTGAGDAVHGLAALVRLSAAQLLPAHAVWVATRRAETDELTGLPNRRALTGAIARQHGERVALIVLDIDFFKRINDTLGHPAGDAALQHLARLLKATVRGQDIAARIGGEEFAIWLPGADLATAMEIAERLRAQVEASPFRSAGAEHTLTISCGVSAYPVPIPHPHNLMSTADAALYQAKNGGRNRVVTAGSPTA